MKRVENDEERRPPKRSRETRERLLQPQQQRQQQQQQQPLQHQRIRHLRRTRRRMLLRKVRLDHQQESQGRTIIQVAIVLMVHVLAFLGIIWEVQGKLHQPLPPQGGPGGHERIRAVNNPNSASTHNSTSPSTATSREERRRMEEGLEKTLREQNNKRGNTRNIRQRRKRQLNNYYGIGQTEQQQQQQHEDHSTSEGIWKTSIHNSHNRMSSSSSSSSSSHLSVGTATTSKATTHSQQNQQQQHSDNPSLTVTTKILDDVFGPPDELDTETTYYTIGTEDGGDSGNGGTVSGSEDVIEQQQNQGCSIFTDECCFDDDCPGDEVCSDSFNCVEQQSSPSQPAPAPTPAPAPASQPTNNNQCSIFVDECCIDADCPGDDVCSDSFNCVEQSSPSLPAPSPTPTRPQQPTNTTPSSPSSAGDDADRCLVPLDECCETKDCFLDGEVCVHRNCIDNGFLRFTVFWEGDDDYDLYVETPGATQIYYGNIFDPVTLGRFDGEADQFGQGYHVENIHFPDNGAPSGEYKYFVRPLTTVGDPDEWTIQVVEDGTVVMTDSGFGFSDQFEYFRQRQSPSPPSPNRPPVGGGPIEPTPPSSPSSPNNTPFPTPAPVSNPIDPPVGVPTRPPQSLDDCTEFSDKCCIDSDCGNPNEVCEQRTCLRDGNPRITLQWTGDDDLDLFVRTPDGVIISAENTFDEVSGGRYQRNDDQLGFGYHVESVYFPVIGAPLGDYEYGVRSVTKRGPSDLWYIEIRESNAIVDTRGGAGDSITYSYVRRDNVIDGPQRPQPEPPACTTSFYDCCADSDCNSSTELCLHRTCINEGSLRVSLTWIGDDDLDLYVETPGGGVISRFSEFDPVSGGRYSDGGVQREFDFHVESIYFPIDGAPIGTYRFYVEAYAIRGYGADVWTVTVYESGVPIQTESGIGDSPRFQYERSFFPTIPNIPNQPPAAQPTPANPPFASCSTDSNCRQDQMCTQKSCIFRGNPQVVLTWTGNDDLDLFVFSPSSPELPIYAFNAYDPISGGRFDGSGIQDSPGSHVENVYFAPNPGPSGTYSYYVHSFRSTNEDDQWTVTIYADGKVIQRDTGRGSSEVVQFDVQIDMDELPSPPDGIDPNDPSCDPAIHQCCSSSACSANEQCAFRQCVMEGSPRFTLNWQGNDDLDLVVLPPLGSVVSFANREDEISGGKFGEQSADQFSFGDHVENIYFPRDGGPLGIYKYQVNSFLPSGLDDEWTVRVYVAGRVVSSTRGSGDSGELTYAFVGLPPTAPPVPSTSQPVLPSPAPTVLNSGTEPTSLSGCSTDSDCQSLTEVCITEFCFSKGLPRFTLQYEGDDDISLTVVTPFGTTLSETNTNELLSGGVYEQEGELSGFGKRVNNIHFPLEGGGPVGTYTFRVNAPLSGQIGDPDSWLLTVHEGDVEVFSRNGTSEADYLYEFSPEPSSTDAPPPTPLPGDGITTDVSPPPAIQCETPNDQCCQDSDCLEDQLCVQRQCIDDGSPRFTLQWIGATDYDLSVSPPIGNTVSLNNQIDEVSGGIFGENGIQVFFGLHVENIFFPLGGPSGTYEVEIRSFQTAEEGTLREQWTLQIYAGGELLQTETGSGNSETISFDYNGLDGRSAGPSDTEVETSCVPDPANYRCCSEKDCGVLARRDLCIANTCMGGKGKSRFTLTWYGDDDLDLVLQMPDGRIIANTELSPDLPDVVFESSQSFDTTDSVGRKLHGENIYFPLDAPTGIYRVFVQSFWQIGDADPWTLEVYIDGVPITTKPLTGTGDASAEFKYEEEEATKDPAINTGTSSFFISGNDQDGIKVSTCNEAGGDC